MGKSLLTFLFYLCFLMASCSNNAPTVLSEDIQIQLLPSSLNFDYGTSEQIIQITSNADFTVFSDQIWCNVSSSNINKGTDSLKISVAENTTNSKRNAIITFKSGNFEKKYSVSQDCHLEINVPEGYRLVWQDEFNEYHASGEKPLLPNATKWWFETGGGGWGNNELERYIPGYEGSDTCSVVSNGTLKIIAKKKGNEVISIRMNTSKSWTYGYFEARLKLPQGKGTWPAFWMMPKNFSAWPDDGEIDIMEEVGYRPNWVSASIHCSAYNHKMGTQKTAEKFVSAAESDFHVYAVEWTESFIKGYVDGENYFTFLNDGKKDKKTWPFNTPFYLKLNLAWGGNWGGAQGVDESKLPATYEIDYVRVFQK